MGGAWEPTEILFMLESFPTSTSVAHVETDCGDGYLKAMGNAEGEHALACELVGTQIAQLLELPTLDFAVIPIPPDSRIKLGNGEWAQPGPAFITRAETGES